MRHLYISIPLSMVFSAMSNAYRLWTRLINQCRMLLIFWFQQINILTIFIFLYIQLCWMYIYTSYSIEVTLLFQVLGHFISGQFHPALSPRALLPMDNSLSDISPPVTSPHGQFTPGTIPSRIIPPWLFHPTDNSLLVNHILS